MAKLTEEQKTFIVQRVAMFDSPSTVADAFKDEFKVVIPRQQVEDYDPAKRPKLHDQWKALHDATRKAFLEETAKVPTAHRAVRIRKLDRMAEKAESKGNMVLAAALLKQIAEEVGDAYTNRRELTGKGGAPIAASLAVRFVRPPAPGGGDAAR